MVAVTAVLCYLSTITETHFVTSDGSGADWIAGLEAAKQALPRYANRLDVPMGIMQNDRWCAPSIHLETNKLRFKFCVDGYAYVTRFADDKHYRFQSHAEAATFLQRYKHILDPSGWFDKKRLRNLAAAQTRLLNPMIIAAQVCGRDIAPPAYVRPDYIANAA